MTKNTMENSEKMESEESSNEPTYVPSPNAVDISPNQDEGVLKEIIKPGVGEGTPCDGDNVFVHYTGKLTDGTVFDTSRDRDVFEFTLGKGEVIKAWDIGVATMKKEEKCILVCKPEYAYGPSGSPPKIPSNATLIFEVELLRWALEDLTPSKDGGILKSVLQKGEGFSTPNEDAIVEVHIVGKYDDVVFEERDVNFPLDEAIEHGIVEGVALAIKSLNKGEVVLLKLTPKYAFGKQGNPEFNIPPNSNVEYEVTLKSFENPKQSWSMNFEEKIEQSEIVKNKGTNFFKNGKYDVALKYYQKVVNYLQNESGLEEDKEKQKNSYMLAGYLNSAACNLKLEDYAEAIKNCEKALVMDENNVKGLFRKAQAEMSLKDYDAAKANFRKVVDIDPNNKAAQQQVAMCNAKLKQILDKEKKTYKNMFEKFAKEDAKKAPENDEEEEKDLENGAIDAESPKVEKETGVED